MSITKTSNPRYVATTVLILALSVVTWQFGCTGMGPTNVTSNPKPPAPVSKNRAKISRLSTSVFVKSSGQTADSEISEDREIQDGDSISTDDNGEACLAFGDCHKVYIYQR